MPTIEGDDYIGWSYNGSTYEFGTRFPQPASDVTLTPVAAPDTYTLFGYVYGTDLDGSEGAALNQIGVAIMQGSEMIANTETDANGYYSFDLPEGYYDVVFTRDQVVYNQVTVNIAFLADNMTDGKMELAHVVLPDTAKNTEVEIASSVSVDSVAGLNDVLAAYLEEEEGVLLSSTLLVTVDPMDTVDANKEEFDAIMDKAAEAGIGTDNLKIFYDINVTLEYGSETTNIISLPDGEYLEFYIPLSGIYQNKDVYYVYRYHVDEEGEWRVDVITNTANQQGEYLEIIDTVDGGQTLKLVAKYYSFYGVAYLEYEPGSVSYDLNSGSGTTPEISWYKQGETVTITSTSVVRSGYTFKGWLNSTDGTVYYAGESFTMPEEGTDVVLTAQWSLIYNPVSVPQTGDITRTPLLIALVGVFAIGMLFTRKKQPKQGK